MELEVQDTQQYIDDDFAEHVEQCKECFPDNFEKRFGPSSFGFFELIDRSMQVYENFEHYVLNSCATATDKEIYERAHKIAQALWDFYQFVALKDFDAEESEMHRHVGEFFDWAKEEIKKREGEVVNLNTLMEEWEKAHPQPVSKKDE